VSMSASGTDLEGHRRFLAQAEAYRFAIVQQLNRLQATKVTYADDRSRNKDPEAAKRIRIDPENWKAIPDFRYRSVSIAEQLQSALPGILILFGWLLALGFGLRAAIRRLGAAA
jgi:ABC-2 type transport system permease protein